VDHLNQKDIHNQPAFSPEYVFTADVQPDMTHYLSQSETLQYHHQRTHCHPPFRPQDAPPPEDILATAIHTASIPATTTSTVTWAPQLEVSPPPQVVKFLLNRFMSVPLMSYQRLIVFSPQFWVYIGTMTFLTATVCPSVALNTDRTRCLLQTLEMSQHFVKLFVVQ